MAKIPQLPTREELLEFIKASPTKISKREIAKAFNLKGDKRVWLKDMLRTLATEGLIERGRKRREAAEAKREEDEARREAVEEAARRAKAVAAATPPGTLPAGE